MAEEQGFHTIDKFTYNGETYLLQDNTSGYIKDAGVTSFNGSTGAVTYTAPASKVFYGTCDTGMFTTEKAVVCSDFTSTNLIEGTIVNVVFTTTNGATSPTLNVNGTGAYNITVSGLNIGGSTLWGQNECCTFVFDGSHWALLGKDEATTSLWGVTKLSNSLSSTSTIHAATANAVKQVNDKVENRVYYSVNESSDHYNVISSSVFDYHPSGDDPTLGLNIQSESADGTDTVNYSLQWSPDTLRLRDNDSDTNLWEFKPNKIVPSSTTPIVDGTATVGTETSYARGDHVHPHDTSKANLASPTFTGTPKAPTASAGTNTTQLATTQFVTTAVSALKKSVTEKTISSTSTANATDVTIGNTGSLAAGTYAITYQAWWNSNATGRRSVYLATSTSGSEWEGTRLTFAPPTSGGLSVRGFILVTLTAATTLYMRTYQNSGSALNAGGRFEILKLH